MASAAINVGGASGQFIHLVRGHHLNVARIHLGVWL
jgi:hypothetical protein